MVIHAIFDVLAWLTVALAYRVMGTRYAWPHAVTGQGRPIYLACLAIGAAIGGIGFGSLNMLASGRPEFARSIEGAILGAIVAVELYKRATGLRGSTGARYALPLALGIAVGRIGCFLSGLEDFTYGTPTSLPWGWDFGDGIARHPVQLYESIAMLGFAVWYGVALRFRYRRVVDLGFYLIIGWYGFQRFFLEFLKPYEPVLGPANIFHLLSAALFIYAVVMARSADEHPSAHGHHDA